MICTHRINPISELRSLVALPPVLDLLLCAKHLFIAAMAAIAGGREDDQWDLFSLKTEQGLASIPMAQGSLACLASIPMAQGSLARLAIASLKSAGGVSSSACGTDAGTDRRSGRATVLRICRVLTAQNVVPQHFWISHHRLGANSEMALSKIAWLLDPERRRQMRTAGAY